MPENQTNDFGVRETMDAGASASGGMPQSNNVTLESPKAEKSKRYMIIVIVAVLVVIIGIVGVLLICNKDNTGKVDEGSGDGDTGAVITDEDEDSDTYPQDEVAQEKAVKMVVAKVKDRVADMESVTIQESNFPVQYRPEGMKVFTTLDKGFGFSVSDYSQLEEFADLVAEELEGSGFLGYYNDSETSRTTVSYLNSKTGVVCNAYFGGWPVSFQCSHKDWISKEAEELINELAEAVEESSAAVYNEWLVISLGEGSVNIEESEFKPYQRISVGMSAYHGVGGAVGLFYRKSSTAKWQFFTATQGPVECELYNTEGLRRAYAGQECWNVVTDEWETVKAE